MITVLVWLAAPVLGAPAVVLAWRAGDAIARYRTRRRLAVQHEGRVMAAAQVYSW